MLEGDRDRAEVRRLAPGSQAAFSRGLTEKLESVGHLVLVSVDGTPATGLPYKQQVDLIGAAARPCTLCLERLKKIGSPVPKLVIASPDFAGDEV